MLPGSWRRGRPVTVGSANHVADHDTTRAPLRTRGRYAVSVRNPALRGRMPPSWPWRSEPVGRSEDPALRERPGPPSAPARTAGRALLLALQVTRPALALALPAAAGRRTRGRLVPPRVAEDHLFDHPYPQRHPQTAADLAAHELESLRPSARRCADSESSPFQLHRSSVGGHLSAHDVRPDHREQPGGVTATGVARARPGRARDAGLLRASDGRARRGAGLHRCVQRPLAGVTQQIP